VIKSVKVMTKNSFKGKKKTEESETWASRVTKKIGSPSSIVFHSIFFVICLLSPLFGIDFDRVLLFLTTIVSLEAIYLSLLIQLTVNKSQENIKKVEEDIDEIQEDVQEIQEDVGEIQEDINEIQEDVDVIEEGEEDDQKRDSQTQEMIANIQTRLESLIGDIEKLKKPQGKINSSKETKT